LASAHGGEIQSAALRLGVPSAQLLDASASLVPRTPRLSARDLTRGLRDYPNRQHHELVGLIARIHGLEASAVLPGNGAAELFTWLARDAAALGISSLPAPGFADYSRALACWQGGVSQHSLGLQWDCRFSAAVSLVAGG
jgi:histidinol-phosphate/aromatic aminotransferase/cobyric acid decarboxylase-like protein